MSKTIGIAGLGWLGLPLAQRLQFLGFQVKGTVTQLEKATALQKKGFNAYPLTLTERGIQGSTDAFLKDIETLIQQLLPRETLKGFEPQLSLRETTLSAPKKPAKPKKPKANSAGRRDGTRGQNDGRSQNNGPARRRQAKPRRQTEQA